ncbi:fumarylacetoacetate hydrolase family protein [Rhizosphaericola mali]|uniref:Fumarylacetoacetate hydrolase family protein n=1 Tax=Rhizosphaericola mali TaxID=2545455 RepID=A0A5P2G547_9BACT|nr:fumarylacetoacetate hydrolase family protein [Rhizosphaericola mali]QES89269.1 fumarylacetoacetate hydrolase family protein [Rhizosphaericola mali]
MKLFRFGNIGEEKAGVLIDGKKYDVSTFGEEFDKKFLSNGGKERLEKFIAENKSTLKEIDDNVRIGVPCADPAKIVCVGLNYADHVKETGLKQENEPILFLKAISSLTGPFDGVTIPKDSHKTDWETELAVVIGKKANYVTEEDAEDYIWGYVLHNDISERGFQTERGGTWDKGKGCDTFAPIGPYLVSKDEIPDSNNLKVWLKLNGTLVQDGTTQDFIYKIPKLIAYISQFMSLNPGDIISTGSPAGVGMGMNPQRFLRDGDVIEYGIDGLGEARQEFKAYK